MERAQMLSEILTEQIRSGAPRESLLWTLGMLRAEILAMPASAVSQVPAADAGAGSAGEMGRAAGSGQVAVSSDAAPARPTEPPRGTPSHASGPNRMPPPAETHELNRTRQSPPVEINQRASGGGASLNDRLRQAAPELAERLLPEAVSDLRSAFGINDRFRMIHELFRGDGAAFDEAIQRLDAMAGVSEALAHIDRELAARGGWDPGHPMVEQLRQSVRRRFSAI